MPKRKLWSRVISLTVLAAFLALAIGCQGPAGPIGPAGPAGPVGPPGAAEEEVAEEVAPVEVDAGGDEAAEPGETVTLKAVVTVNDASTITSYQWTQVSGVDAALSGADSDTLEVSLPDLAKYKGYLMSTLRTQDRFEVQAIDPHALEGAEGATFKVTVVTASGSYSDTVTVTAHLPYVISLGIGNVPKGLAVLIHGKDRSAYDWSLAGPSDSTAALDNASVQNPSFTPDVVGKYTLTESNSGATVEVYAGTWAGVITAQDADGLPLSAGCTTCHNDSLAADKFTAWKASGHAEIFSSNLNTSTHYGESCFACHTVGFNKDADNNGFDEASDYDAFLNAGLINTPSPQNWATVLSEFPDTARLANIQCESCHGPNDGSTLHANGTLDAARISIASEVCGACHGEPPRHGRYQQWEEIGHGNLELAIEEATVENRGGTARHCGRCHSGQGFLAWIEQGDLTQQIQGADGNATEEELAALGLTEDTVQPQTCVVCHDPHQQGITSGEPNTATVRIEGSTPLLPAGFQAVGVGRGALCMACHNSRNGARNDVVTTTQDDRAPHTAAQADVLMGENAFFVTVGSRSPHSLIADSCTNCHMQLSPPPAELSYNLGGTNHAFDASTEICTSCHGVFDGGSLHEVIEAKLEQLEEAIAEAIIAEITVQTDAGRVFVLKGAGAGDADVEITDGNTITALEFLESHGRQAINVTVDGTTYEHIRLASDTELRDADGNVLDESIIDSDMGQIIAKAGWNYFLIEGDGSHGVHNPSFALNVLNASIAALQ